MADDTKKPSNPWDTFGEERTGVYWIRDGSGKPATKKPINLAPRKSSAAPPADPPPTAPAQMGIQETQPFDEERTVMDADFWQSHGLEPPSPNIPRAQPPPNWRHGASDSTAGDPVDPPEAWDDNLNNQTDLHQVITVMVMDNEAVMAPESTSDNPFPDEERDIAVVRISPTPPLGEWAAVASIAALVTLIVAALRWL